jgi:CRISPR-associated protein Csm2
VEREHNSNNSGGKNNQYQNRGGYERQPSYKLPDGYLKDGYFEFDEVKKIKKLKKDLILDMAEKISIGISNERSPELTKTQLRRFYDYTKNISEKLRMHNDVFEKVEIDIMKLKNFAADAKTKGKIPNVFYDFINKNIQTIKNIDDFKKGFIEHFQAVVAYYPKKN